MIAGYLLLVLYIGFYFRRRMHSAEDYFAGGHQVPWWLAGVSHYISSASALTFVAYSQMGYQYGFVSIVVGWTAVPACILGGLFFARRWRQARVSTPVEFLERRFNGFVRQLMAWAGVPMKVGTDGLKLFSTSLLLAVGLQIPVAWAVLACGTIAIAYTFLGGLWALTVTDYVQFLMKALVLIMLVPLAIWRAGGVVHAVQALPPDFFHVTNGMYNWTYIAGFFVMLSITLNGSWSLAQKFNSVSDTRQAQKAAYLSAVLYLIGMPVMILPAILGRIFLPDLIAQHQTANVYAHLMIALLPAGMVGIVIALLLAATMAMVGADFSAIASVMTKDVYQRLFRPDATPERLVWVGRLITLLTGSLSILIALYFSLRDDQQILHLMVLMASAFLAPSFLPLMAALVSRRVNSQGVVTGFFVGLTSGLLMLAARTWLFPHGYWPWLRENFDGASILINTGMTIVGMWIGTLLAGSSPAEARKYDLVFCEREELSYTAQSKASPINLNRIISKATLAVAGLLGLAGILAPGRAARITDLSVALVIAALAWNRFRSARKQTEEKVLVSAKG